MQCSYDRNGNSVPTILLLLQERLYDQGGLKVLQFYISINIIVFLHPPTHTFSNSMFGHPSAGFLCDVYDSNPDRQKEYSG